VRRIDGAKFKEKIKKQPKDIGMNTSRGLHPPFTFKFSKRGPTGRCRDMTNLGEEAPARKATVAVRVFRRALLSRSVEKNVGAKRKQG